jgi:c-di-GMP-related signal transduction protein
VPIDLESKAVLLGESSSVQPFYQLMLAQEAGDWKTVNERTMQLSLAESDVAAAYLQAMQWAREVTAGT